MIFQADMPQNVIVAASLCEILMLILFYFFNFFLKLSLGLGQGVEQKKSMMSIVTTFWCFIEQTTNWLILTMISRMIDDETNQ